MDVNSEVVVSLSPVANGAWDMIVTERVAGVDQTSKFRLEADVPPIVGSEVGRAKLLISRARQAGKSTWAARTATEHFND